MTNESKHFYAGATISYISGGIIYKKTNKQFLSCAAGIGIGALAGLAKEYYYDKHLGRGVFSKDDYQLTSWGALCGGISLCIVIDFNRKK